MPAGDSAAPDTDELRRAAILISEFISDTILDPHTGFLEQFAGAARLATSRDELRELLGRLFETLEMLELPAEQMATLESSLAATGLPSLQNLQTICSKI